MKPATVASRVQGSPRLLQIADWLKKGLLYNLVVGRIGIYQVGKARLLIALMGLYLSARLLADSACPITCADVRQDASHEDGQDSPGDIFVFDQKPPGVDHPGVPDNPGNNGGRCTRTLTFARTFRSGETIAVTADYLNAAGSLHSTPLSLESGRVLFKRELVFLRGHLPGGAR